MQIIYSKQTEYLKWDSQSSPQPVELVVNGSSEKVYIDTDGNIGNCVCEAEYNGRIICFRFPDYCYTSERCNEFLDENKKILEHLIGSYTEEWDNGNLIGRFDADLIDKVSSICSEFEGDDYITSSDYLYNSRNFKFYLDEAKALGFDILTENGLEKYSDRIEKEAKDAGILLVDSIYDSLEQERETYKNELQEEAEFNALFED